MIVTNTRAEFELTATASSDQSNIDGDFVLGLQRRSLAFDAEKAYSLKADCPENGSFTFNPATGVATPVETWPSGKVICDGDGNDIDGNPLGTIVPLAMLIEATKAVLVDFNQGETAETMTINGGGFFLQCNATTPSMITISAPTGGEVNITLIGN